MKWHSVEDTSQLDALVRQSDPVLFFKHSYRCSISAAARNRFESQWPEQDQRVDTFLIDVVKERPLSQQLAERTGVEHASPQVLVLRDGKVIYQATHLNISTSEVGRALAGTTA